MEWFCGFCFLFLGFRSCFFFGHFLLIFSRCFFDRLFLFFLLLIFSSMVSTSSSSNAVLFTFMGTAFAGAFLPLACYNPHSFFFRDIFFLCILLTVLLAILCSLGCCGCSLLARYCYCSSWCNCCLFVRVTTAFFAGVVTANFLTEETIILLSGVVVAFLPLFWGMITSPPRLSSSLSSYSSIGGKRHFLGVTLVWLAFCAPSLPEWRSYRPLAFKQNNLATSHLVARSPLERHPNYTHFLKNQYSL